VAVGHERKIPRCKAEIEVEGTIRAGHGADAAMIVVIVHALKASRRSARPEQSG
jgi:hypothetical protein